MNRDGFVLIEVIVSVILLSIVSIALLNIDSNQHKLYSTVSNRLEFTRYCSILLNRKSTNLHNKKLNLYSLTKADYEIKNRSLIESLKSIDIEYKQKYKELIKLDEIELLMDRIELKSRGGISKYVTIKM